MKIQKVISKASALFVICLGISLSSLGQMGEATRIRFDIDTTVKFNVSVSTLWETLKDPSKWANFSNGYVQSITVNGNLPNQTRVLHFADGSERKDIVLQYQPEYKFIVLKVTDPFSQAITDNVLTFTSESADNGLSKLVIGVKVDGKDKEKTALLGMLRKEIDSYIIGLTKLFSQKN